MCIELKCLLSLKAALEHGSIHFSRRLFWNQPPRNKDALKVTNEGFPSKVTNQRIWSKEGRSTVVLHTEAHLENSFQKQIITGFVVAVYVK